MFGLGVVGVAAAYAAVGRMAGGHFQRISLCNEQKLTLPLFRQLKSGALGRGKVV